MDRDPGATRYIPNCPRNIAPVDQYMWKDKDTNQYMCQNGISHAIYDCKGMINYTLPLEEYPPVDRVHPQIEMTRRMHMQWRTSPYKKEILNSRFPFNEGFSFMDDDMASRRIEGFYSNDSIPSRLDTGRNARFKVKHNSLNPASDMKDISYDSGIAPYISTSSTGGRGCSSCSGGIRPYPQDPGYSGPLPPPGMYMTSYKEEGYPLPNPNGGRGCSACGC